MSSSRCISSTRAQRSVAACILGLLFGCAPKVGTSTQAPKTQQELPDIGANAVVFVDTFISDPAMTASATTQLVHDGFTAITLPRTLLRSISAQSALAGVWSSGHAGDTETALAWERASIDFEEALKTALATGSDATVAAYVRARRGSLIGEGISTPAEMSDWIAEWYGQLQASSKEAAFPPEQWLLGKAHLDASMSYDALVGALYGGVLQSPSMTRDFLNTATKGAYRPHTVWVVPLEYDSSAQPAVVPAHVIPTLDAAIASQGQFVFQLLGSDAQVLNQLSGQAFQSGLGATTDKKKRSLTPAAWSDYACAPLAAATHMRAFSDNGGAPRFSVGAKVAGDATRTQTSVIYLHGFHELIAQPDGYYGAVASQWLNAGTWNMTQYDEATLIEPIAQKYARDFSTALKEHAHAKIETARRPSRLYHCKRPYTEGDDGDAYLLPQPTRPLVGVGA